MDDLVIKNIGQLITLNPGVVRKGKGAGELGILRDTSISVKDGKISSIGDSGKAKKTIDAKGNVVMPGFVDCHTHLVFGGQRANEFEARASGKTYVEIAEAGGGIASTVKSTRGATESELFETAIRNLDHALSWGTTSIEIKSGYGLSLSEEIKILRVIQSLKKQHPIAIAPTFLGAHSVPTGGNRDDYIAELLERQIPEASKLAKFCDVFCEKGVFSKEESRVILQKCKEFGLGLKIHADEITSCGGSELAGELGAISADHVVYPSSDGIQAMKKGGTIAVVLPGACLFLSHKPPVKKFMEAGIPIAIGSDFNPGSSPVLSMPVVLGLACTLLDFTPAHAIAAGTINAAHAIGLAERTGSLEVGKDADILVLNVDSYQQIPYWFGFNPVEMVIVKGKPISHRMTHLPALPAGREQAGKNTE